MKYLLLAFLAVLLLALLGLPPVFGRLAETAFEAQVAAIGPDDPLAIEIESYERGWFSSRARLAVTRQLAVTRGSAPSSSAPLPVDLRIDHGPVSLRDGFFVGFTRLSARSPENPFTFDAITDFDGEAHFTALLPALEGTRRGATYSLAEAELSGSKSRDRLVVHGRAKSVEVAGPRGVLSLEDVVLDTGGELIRPIGLPADIDLTIAHAIANVPGADQPVTAEHISLRSTLSKVDASPSSADAASPSSAEASPSSAEASPSNVGASPLLNGVLEVDAAEIQSGDRVEMTGLRARTATQRLDLAALQNYSEAVARLGTAGTEDAARTAALEPSIKQILAAGPTLSIEPLVFDFNGQPFEGTLDAAANPDSLSGIAVGIDDAQFWYQVIEGTLELKAAKSLVESAATTVIRRRAAEAAESGRRVPFGNADTAGIQAGLMLAVLATQGFLEDEGENYATTLRIGDGAITVNGRRLPLAFPASPALP